MGSFFIWGGLGWVDLNMFEIAVCIYLYLYVFFYLFGFSNRYMQMDMATSLILHIRKEKNFFFFSRFHAPPLVPLNVTRSAPTFVGTLKKTLTAG